MPGRGLGAGRGAGRHCGESTRRPRHLHEINAPLTVHVLFDSRGGERRRHRERGFTPQTGMARTFEISPENLRRLREEPGGTVSGKIGDGRYRARVLIPHYGQRIARHYGCDLAQTPVGFDFGCFGLHCAFESPTEIDLYSSDLRLCDTVRDLIARFGPVTFANAYMAADKREGQRNIFPSLDFHYDRAPEHENQYSLFHRDPFCKIQKEPRKSTTLILANTVAYLQEIKEGGDLSKFRSLHHLFEQEHIPNLVGEIMLETTWCEPRGTGEIVVFDNRTVLHASFYKGDAGYPIGVRYLV